MARGRPLDLRGRTFDALVALEPEGRDKKRRVTWECLCDPSRGGCGRTTVVSSDNLVRGGTRSCGCLQQTPRDTRVAATRVRAALARYRGDVRAAASATGYSLTTVYKYRRSEDAPRAARRPAGRRGVRVEFGEVEDSVAGWAGRLGVSEQYLRQLARRFNGDWERALRHCQAGTGRRFPKHRCGRTARDERLEFGGLILSLRDWASFYGLTFKTAKSEASRLGGWPQLLASQERRKRLLATRRSPPRPGEHESLDACGPSDGMREPMLIARPGGSVVGRESYPDQSSP